MAWFVNPVGRLFGAVLSIGLLWLLWATIGQGIVDDVRNDALQQGGSGPQSVRIVNQANFTPVVAALRGKVGPDAELLAVTLRPTSVEFVVRDGEKATGYRSYGSTDLQPVGVNLYGGGDVADSAYPIGKLDEGGPEKIAAAISRKESGDFNLTSATLERQPDGKLLWNVKGTVDGRGVAYVAKPSGTGVELFNPAQQ